MIENNIKEAIAHQFGELREAIAREIGGEFDIETTKAYLHSYLPKEIIRKSELLLDTLINYLMKSAIDKLKSADITLQNEFYRYDFRLKIKDWTSSLNNQLSLSLPNVEFKFDPRVKNGMIAGGVALVIGASTTFLSSVNAIIGGLLTIITAAIAYKFAHNKSASQARASIRDDVENFLSQAQEDITKWLQSVQVAFVDDFTKFCKERGFEFDGELK